jgi:hypothetical protein
MLSKDVALEVLVVVLAAIGTWIIFFLFTFKISSDVMWKSKDINLIVTIRYLEKLGQWIASLIIEMFRDDTSWSEVAIELWLYRVDPLHEVIGLASLSEPKRMALELFPINSLDRVFLQESLQKIIELLREAIYSREVWL